MNRLTIKIIIITFLTSCMGVDAKLNQGVKRDFLFMIGKPVEIKKIEEKYSSLTSKVLITMSDRVSVKIKPIKVFDLFSELENNYDDSIEIITNSHAGALSTDEEIYLIFEIIDTNKLRFIRWKRIQKTVCFSNSILDELGLKNQFSLVNSSSNYRCDTIPE